MKQFLVFFTLANLFFSCKILPPEFKNIESWKVENINTDNIKLTNNAVFYNPNSVGILNIKKINLNIMVDGKQLGTINQNSSSTNIKAMSEFTIPLAANIDSKNLINNLGSIISIITSKEMDVNIDGYVSFGKLFFTKKIYLNQKQKVKF